MKGDYNFSKPEEGRNSRLLDSIGKIKRMKKSPLIRVEMFRDLVERLPVGVFLSNKDGKFIYVNEKFAKIGGWTVDEIEGKKYARDLVHPEDIPRLEQHVKNQLLGKPAPQVVAFRGMTKTTQIVYLESRDCLLKTPGAASLIVGTIVKVTRHKRTEEELKKCRDHLQELIEEHIGQLAEVNKELRQEIEKCKHVEAALEFKSRDLDEANIALKVLLKQQEDDRRELEKKISSNVRELVLPNIAMLQEEGLEPNKALLIDAFERNLKDLVSPFCTKVTSFNFTRREIEVIHLAKEGKTIKETAQLFNVTVDAISRHRYRIRKKLGLDRRQNLLPHILSLD
jgi:PAS domain S-box-containing protein